MKLNLKTLCAFCGLPFGQGDHAHCVIRMRALQFVNPKDGALVRTQRAYLQRNGYKAKEKVCWCGETFHWRGQQCHAHTRAWTTLYGGRLRTRHTPAKCARTRETGVSKAGSVAKAFGPCVAPGQQGRLPIELAERQVPKRTEQTERPRPAADRRGPQRGV